MAPPGLTWAAQLIPWEPWARAAPPRPRSSASTRHVHGGHEDARAVRRSDPGNSEGPGNRRKRSLELDGENTTRVKDVDVFAHDVTLVPIAYSYGTVICEAVTAGNGSVCKAATYGPARA